MKPKRQSFSPARITLFFAALCIAIFLAMLASSGHALQFDRYALLRWGGNYRPLTLAGQWWRLLSAIFVHGGLLHLLFNMIALLDIGLLLERKVGKIMLAVIFVV